VNGFFAANEMPGLRASNILQFFFEQRVAQHMSSSIRSVSPTTTLRELGKLIERFDYNAFPVLDNERLLGIVTKFDFLRAFIFTEQRLLPDYDSLMNTPVAKVMSSKIIVLQPDEPLTRVLEKMVKLRLRSFPVVEAKALLGMIARSDIVKALDQSVHNT
jgi:CBS domain-containing protein